MRIGDYECETPFATVGSGSARWCVAQRGGQRFFLKQFLSPVQPAESGLLPEQRALRKARCDLFERRKKALYSALRCVLGDCVVPVTDFFAFDNRYFAVSAYVHTPFETLETIGCVNPARARQLLYALASCLAQLHAQGVVHADLKPEHVLIEQDGGSCRLRLIDFDSGFLESDPPIHPRDIEGDPVYLAPETYLRMTGESATLTHKVDTFAFAAIAHRLWVGNLPPIQASQHTYLYAAVLSGTEIPLDAQLPTAYRWLLRKAFSLTPEERPDDGLLVRLLAPPFPAPPSTQVVPNGLGRYWKPSR